MIWLICDSLPFCAHVHICSPSYTDEKQTTNVDSETICHKLLIKDLIVPIRRLWILSIACLQNVFQEVHRCTSQNSTIYLALRNN